MSFPEVDLHLAPFVPIFPFLTGHSQTIIGHMLPSTSALIKYTETILALEDGDELLLEYFDSNSSKTISIYHGLAGDSTAEYVRRSAELANQLGWNLVLVNHRGASGKAKSARTYHLGRGEDASAVISWAKKKFKGSQQIALGFSMSGSILLNLLTERYGVEKPDIAIVVNAPLYLRSAAEKLSAGLSRIYDYKFYSDLKKIIQKREKLSLPAWGRTYDIDDIYTSKINGFKDAYDYYDQCSPGPFVDRINTKTFVLTAYDDPFIDINGYLNAKWSPQVHLTMLRSGGHMGYINRHADPKYGRRWLDHYLDSVFTIIRRL